LTGWFDFDHLSTEITKDLSAEGASQQHAQFDDTQAF
jgi:hypothetical protein